MRRAVVLSALLLALAVPPGVGEPLVEATPMPGSLVLAGVARQGDVDIGSASSSGCFDAVTDVVLRAAFVPSSPDDVVTLRFRMLGGILVRTLTADVPTLRVAFESPDSCVRLTVEGTAVAHAAPYVVTSSFVLLERRLPA